MKNAAFAASLRQAREKVGSRVALAEKIGVSTQSLKRWESGEFGPRSKGIMDKVLKIIGNGPPPKTAAKTKANGKEAVSLNPHILKLGQSEEVFAEVSVSSSLKIQLCLTAEQASRLAESCISQL